ncbi:CPBP family intramembrane metalloprotease [Paenibacillus xerothermodurans]|uniref:CPBP family intramembrane metalloprotease n=2 Tax=Paenibacillus xerothermodurans TaxID=1977292 RepID=A0A2W1NZX8_PAEXE|nr:CPBP family intramembrane metalloprotease [Paenibacillus xerothermodurans]
MVRGLNVVFLCLAPTAMLLLGWNILHSVPVTFLLFYGFLLSVPFIELMLYNRRTFGEACAEFAVEFKSRNMLYGVIAGIIFMFVITGTLSLLQEQFFDQDELRALLLEWHFSGAYVIALATVLIVINPFLEEIYWRGYMLSKLRRTMGIMNAILITSICYSLYHLFLLVPMFHWPFNVLAVIPVFIAGVFWGWLRHKSDSLLGSIVSHILADVGIMLVYFKFLY